MNDDIEQALRHAIELATVADAIPDTAKLLTLGVAIADDLVVRDALLYALTRVRTADEVVVYIGDDNRRQSIADAVAVAMMSTPQDERDDALHQAMPVLEAMVDDLALPFEARSQVQGIQAYLHWWQGNVVAAEEHATVAGYIDPMNRLAAIVAAAVRHRIPANDDILKEPVS